MCVFLLVTHVLSQVSDQSYVCFPVSDTCPKPGKWPIVCVCSCVFLLLRLTLFLRYLHWIFEEWGRFMVLNATFSYIVAVSFIGGGNRSIRRKQPTCNKSLTNFITYCCIECIPDTYWQSTWRYKFLSIVLSPINTHII